MENALQHVLLIKADKYGSAFLQAFGRSTEVRATFKFLDLLTKCTKFAGALQETRRICKLWEYFYHIQQASSLHSFRVHQ